jgi:hypothetical protein
VHVQAAGDQVLELPAASLTSGGNQNALTQFLGQAALALSSGQLIEAQHKLEQAILRTDGCALRGRPDPNGPGRDWITTCAGQEQVYRSLVDALAAVTP